MSNPATSPPSNVISFFSRVDVQNKAIQRRAIRRAINRQCFLALDLIAYGLTHGTQKAQDEAMVLLRSLPKSIWIDPGNRIWFDWDDSFRHEAYTMVEQAHPTWDEGQIERALEDWGQMYKREYLKFAYFGETAEFEVALQVALDNLDDE